MTIGVQMILPVKNTNDRINFSANKKNEKKELEYNHDTLLENSFVNRAAIGVDKLTNAMTVYPAKGFKGSKNANFYEFLTMGTIPYIIGSVMLMAVFNAASKYFEPFSRAKAGEVGKKMALGVLFYGIMKEVSKSFISKPVKWATGIDTEQPYAKVIYELPDDIYDTDIMSIEHHKVFESVEFPRWDLLYGDTSKGEKLNFRYDKIAKKLGMGKNLKDSDQEVKPRIKEIVIKSNMAKNISSYLWAATGVAVAIQKPWEKYFEVMTFKFWDFKKFCKSIKSFGKSFKESIEAFYKGEGSGIKKQAGKILLGLAAFSTVIGLVNTLISRKTPSQLSASDIVDKNRKYVVN